MKGAAEIRLERWLIVNLCLLITVSGLPMADYWAQRGRLLADEQLQSIGGNLRFQREERLANDVLMCAKHKEIDEGFLRPTSFLPSRNFLDVRRYIERSEVFRIIRSLPKGAVLHSHDTAMVSFDYVYNNITFRKNLYVCDVNGELKLKFFSEPDSDCEWELLSDVRNDAARADLINHRIRSQLTMETSDSERAYPDVDTAWKKFMSIFAFITPMLTYRPVYEDHFYRALEELYDDNVLYVELRSTLPTLYDLNGTVYSPVELVGLYKEIADRFVKDHPDFMGAKLIYAPHRGVSDERMDEYLDILRQLRETYPSFVAGFDLVGQEDKGQPLIDFANKLRNKSMDVDFFFHAGETNWNGMSTDENLSDAVLLKSKRIGHGYAILKHPVLAREIRRNNIAIEVSPISNQVLGLVKDLRNHPASTLFAEGFPVVVSNDDPGLWGAKGLSYDFYEAFMGLMSRQADLRALKQLAINSLLYSSMSVDERKKAMKIWYRKWDEFVKATLEEKLGVLF